MPASCSWSVASRCGRSASSRADCAWPLSPTTVAAVSTPSSPVTAVLPAPPRPMDGVPDMPGVTVNRRDPLGLGAMAVHRWPALKSSRCPPTSRVSGAPSVYREGGRRKFQQTARSCRVRRWGPGPTSERVHATFSRLFGIAIQGLGVVTYNMFEAAAGTPCMMRFKSPLYIGQLPIRRTLAPPPADQMVGWPRKIRQVLRFRLLRQ